MPHPADSTQPISRNLRLAETIANQIARHSPSGMFINHGLENRQKNAPSVESLPYGSMFINHGLENRQTKPPPSVESTSSSEVRLLFRNPVFRNLFIELPV
ncbi:Uncharacterized protein Fot_50183 [Forsythia ovata]|uniref:Uncharacterized protein n=1 Tax=Forsythia ovata TaxID=205694 RepID=A0ABD1PYC4_9LAMI